jgi:hypothetical protein
MIRPLTIVTFLLASGSGGYLYESKHDAQVLDKTIERAVHETSALRDQSRLLVAEWTMLNDPGRLRQFSDTYLNLKSIAPGQYTSLADLDTRLPPARVEPPHVDQPPVASAAEPAPEPAPAAAPATEAEPEATPVADEELPVPPIPVPPHAVAVAAPRPVEHPAEHVTERPTERVAERPAPPPKPPEIAPPRMMATATPKPVEQRASHPHDQGVGETRVSEARPIELHPSAPPPQRPAPAPAVAAMAPRPATPSPAPSAVANAAPYGGSLLGMARGSMQPAPRPMPVSSTQWSNTN